MSDELYEALIKCDRLLACRGLLTIMAKIADRLTAYRT